VYDLLTRIAKTPSAPNGGKHSAKQGILVRQTALSSAPNHKKHATNAHFYAFCRFWSHRIEDSMKNKNCTFEGHLFHAKF
jgi:hypothetical protein